MKRFAAICALVGALAVNNGCASAEKQIPKPVQITPINEMDVIPGTYEIELFHLRKGATLNPNELGRVNYLAEIDGGKYKEPHLLQGYDINGDKIPDAVMVLDKNYNLVDVGLNKDSLVYNALKEKLKDKLIPNKNQED